ncbi:MAG: phosphatidylserine/phosphatidylglycerophosphate/cardiolipin synthase family protein [Akkermansiaceae bacterium]|jgi:cardiolipin synthase A/B|nr:phosphatidylserine/phosphatidylglycerophosphate/cardiolipin synthase family protein [Akkermansiaceae bacterium]MDP4646141.1 phosphatidylserine/phosphatidylglycerophosphate/cardiolipin synthase family protein [Akkermansiaceae bacterium]MDP4720940.1 phosphatidylserine/phosphatidylglycerophosphate/cardiolipin synthase family protein [Akkermansiaceae bacterium]MDP4780701.1 phosphatidylserine/phosphatidylglycerophosphate/cardiolipin synthase family protein [Akkermansiaceae bacterium]MDP4845647.1 
MISPSSQNSAPKTVTLDSMMAGKALARTTLRGLVVAGIKQPITSTRRGLAVMWHRPSVVVTGNLPQQMVNEPHLPDAPGTPAFERMLDSKGFPSAKEGSLKWLVDGDEFFGELDRQLAGAQKSLRMQLYIFDNDDIAVRYADKLKARSREIDIDVLYDDLGSATAWLSAPKTSPPAGYEPPGDMKKYLEDGSEIEVRRSLNPWVVADHTKLIVIDGRTAILGGMNMGREYYDEWHDLMVRVEGPVVGDLADISRRKWRLAGPLGDLGLFTKVGKSQSPSASGESVPIRVLRTESGDAVQEIFDASLLAIRGAKQRIYIENPYFASDEIVIAVCAAAMRGVDVRVVMPAEGDSVIMDAGNLETARVLIESGAKVYRFPEMAHMKVMVCDDWATMGSANLDTLSMRINSELNIAFSDKGEVERLMDVVFRPDIAKSRRIRLKETDKREGGFMEAVADQL